MAGVALLNFHPYHFCAWRLATGERYQMIALAACFETAQCGFISEHKEDWETAERVIDQLFTPLHLKLQ